MPEFRSGTVLTSVSLADDILRSEYRNGGTKMELAFPDCDGGPCSYAAEGGIAACIPGDGSCRSAYLVEGTESAHHTKKLKHATRAINALFKSVKPGPSPNHKLSFLRTPRGVVLGWVNHGASEGTIQGWARPDEERVLYELGFSMLPPPGSDCDAGLCSYSFSDGACQPGNGDCWAAFFLEPDKTTEVHSESARDATKAVKAILKVTESEGNGRNLALVHTDAGTILVWASHSAA